MAIGMLSCVVSPQIERAWLCLLIGHVSRHMMRRASRFLVHDEAVFIVVVWFSYRPRRQLNTLKKYSCFIAGEYWLMRKATFLYESEGMWACMAHLICAAINIELLASMSSKPIIRPAMARLLLDDWAGHIEHWHGYGENKDSGIQKYSVQWYHREMKLLVSGNHVICRRSARMKAVAIINITLIHYRLEAIVTLEPSIKPALGWLISNIFGRERHGNKITLKY